MKIYTRHLVLKSTITCVLLIFGLDLQGTHRGTGTPSRSTNNRSTSHSRRQTVRPISEPRPSVAAYRALPLSFEPNLGQADASVKYLSHGPGYALFLTKTEAALSIGGKCQDSPLLQNLNAKSRKRFEARKFGRVLLRHYERCQGLPVQMVIDGANSGASVEALEELPGKSNYFIGTDRSKWRAGVPNYARVRYIGIYPGVDLVYYGNRGRLEFDFIVSPGADPNEIALEFAPRGHLRVIRNGNLRLGSRRDALLLRRPSIYQVEHGRKHVVRGGFVLVADGRVAFRIGRYDRKEPLILDPVLTYSTFLDGTSGDSDGDGIAVDSSGDAYVVGTTFSPTFPTVNAYQSTAAAPGNGIVFLTKFNPAGTQLLYSTYLGGTGGDYGTGIAIDMAGNACVTGYTFSTDFPTVSGFQTSNNNAIGGNAFVSCIGTTLTGSASLRYSSYLGGGGNPFNPNPLFGDTGFGIATDSSGRAYVTGATTSDTSVTAFPTTANAYQSSLSSTNGNAFLTAVDTTKSGSSSLIYSTYLGGDGAGSFGDFGVGVATDGAGDAYLVGETTSNASGPFPTTASAYQSHLNSPSGNVFVSEIATVSPSLVYSTYFGGSASGSLGDQGVAVTLDSTDKVYVAGDAESSDFPTTSGAFQTANSANGKAFIAKFDLGKSGMPSLVYSTLLGGTNSTLGDDGNGIAVDGSGDAFAVGQTSSTNFPTTSDPLQSSLHSSGGWNAFLTELSPDASGLIYSTYLGGSSSFGDVATGVALDSATNAYIVGYTESFDFPTTAGAFQTTLNGSQSAFVTELSSPNSPSIAVTANPTSETIVSGQSAEYALIVGSQGSFSGPISFSCSGLPARATCNFSPASVIPSSGAVNTTLTITTTGPGMARLFPVGREGSERTIYVVAASYCLLVITSVLLLAGEWSSRRLRTFLTATAALAIIGMIGCGSAQSVPSTPAGTNFVSVEASGRTASGTAISSVSVTLTVQ